MNDSWNQTEGCDGLFYWNIFYYFINNRSTVNSHRNMYWIIFNSIVYLLTFYVFEMSIWKCWFHLPSKLVSDPVRSINIIRINSEEIAIFIHFFFPSANSKQYVLCWAKQRVGIALDKAKLFIDSDTIKLRGPLFVLWFSFVSLHKFWLISFNRLQNRNFQFVQSLDFVSMVYSR